MWWQLQRGRQNILQVNQLTLEDHLLAGQGGVTALTPNALTQIGLGLQRPASWSWPSSHLPCTYCSKLPNLSFPCWSPLRFFSTGETISGQNCVGRDEEEGGIRDEIACPLGLLLGIFECVDILGDALHVQMAVLHFILQRQQIKGMEAAE